MTRLFIFLTEDSENGNVPDGFPGTVRVSDWDMKDKEVKVLHPYYRAYGSADNPEFYYFVTRIITISMGIQKGLSAC